MSEAQNESVAELASARCPRARSNLEAAVDVRTRLPKNVFNSGWTNFHLFDSDWMFERAFVAKVRAILQHEDADCGCIINLDRDVGDKSATFVIDAHTSDEDYQRRLVGSGPGDGWVYDMDRFGCTSSIGSWCIYCERASELAIIGFRAEVHDGQYDFVLASLHASRVVAVGAGTRSFQFPTHVISQSWQEEIVRNYGPA